MIFTLPPVDLVPPAAEILLVAEESRDIEAPRAEVMKLCASGKYDTITAVVNELKVRFVCDQLIPALKFERKDSVMTAPGAVPYGAEEICSQEEKALNLCGLTERQKDLRKQTLEAVKKREENPLSKNRDRKSLFGRGTPVSEMPKEQTAEPPPPPPKRASRVISRQIEADCSVEDAALNLCDLTPSQRRLRRIILKQPEPKEDAMQTSPTAIELPGIGTPSNAKGEPVEAKAAQPTAPQAPPQQAKLPEAKK